jgi:tetratricopeptide (TPR) repeat protein
MSIKKKTGQRHLSQAEGNHALELFTDRYEFSRLFAEYLNESPREKILFFHGDGGNGKSLLLKFLRQRCCKRFRDDIWQQIKGKPDAELAAYIEESADSWEFTPIPAVVQDFGQKPIGDDQPQDPFYGLLMLRRNLADAAKASGYRLRFPLYDFACVWYFHEKGQLTQERIKEIFPSEELELIGEIVDLVAEIPGVGLAKAVFGIFNKRVGEQFTVLQRKWGLDEEKVRQIQAMEPDSELIDELPCLLAADLNAAMEQPKAPPRIVLFFDTHEAFWGQQRQIRGDLFFQRDEWLRCLLAELELSAGIVAVVAGREKPRWAEARKQRIPSEYLDSQSVGHLSVADARDYLQRAGIREAALTDALITYSSVEPDRVQPFLLALCVDVVQKAQERGIVLTPADFRTVAEEEEKPKELIERLLKYVDEDVADAVHALSAARAFDRELYFQLGEALHFHATDASFRILTRFSFVWQDKRRGENWYRIHDLLRRLNDESGNETTRHAHEVLEQHYRERGEVAEAIYHANRLDWERGVKEWVQVLDQALELRRNDQCRTLLEVRGELWVQSDFQLGRVSESEGDYFTRLARYAEAKQEYLEAADSYNRALNFAPDDINALIQQGNTLAKLGDLQALLAQHPQALQSYSDAIATYRHVLDLALDDVEALNNKALTLQKLGDLQAQLAQHPQALQSYSDAIATYNLALTLDSDYTYALDNKVIALRSLGELQTQREQYPQALQSYSDALATCNHVLTLALDDIDALNNKGNTLTCLGDLQTRLAPPLALLSYLEAIAIYNYVLTLASDDITTLNNKGIALSSLGTLQAQEAEHSQALQLYSEAIAAYNQALTLAPAYIPALNNKGVALKSLGDLQTRLAPPFALLSYSEAISAYNSVLTFAPDDVNALNNKGLALVYLGDLQVGLEQYEDALKNWQAAFAVFSCSLKIAPDNQRIRNYRDRLQENLDYLADDT